MSQDRAGYSLGELIAVVFALSLAAAIAVPNFVTPEAHELEVAAREFAEALRFARSEALRTGEPHGIHEDAGALRIRVHRTDTSATPWSPVYDVVHPVSKRLYDVALPAHPFARADTVTPDRGFRGTCNDPSFVYFDAAGVPWCGDPETVLVEHFALAMQRGAHIRTVTLEGITGRVTVE